MAPSTSNRPRGRTKCGPSPPLSTAWGSRKRAVISISAKPSRTVTPTWAMGCTPSGRSTTAAPRPHYSPDAEHGVERRHDRPADLPLDRNAMGIHRDIHGAVEDPEQCQRHHQSRQRGCQQRQRNDGAIEHPATSATIRLPCRATIQPAIGMDTRDPPAMASRASPSTPGLKSSFCWTVGICGTQLAKAVPLTRKMAATAILAWAGRNASVSLTACTTDPARLWSGY